MSDPRAHFVANKYYGDGISAPGPDDLIGASAGDFMPFLKMAGGMVGGLLGGGGKEEGGGGSAQMMQMMMMQQQQQAAAQAAAQAQAAREASARNQMLLFAGIGVVVLGGLFFVLKK